MSGSLVERIALLAAGSWGKGPSAAELGMQTGMIDAVEELDSYQMERKRAGG